MKPLCLISCPILTLSGYGSRSRDFVKALLELKGNDWDIKVLPQRWGSTTWLKPTDEYAWIEPLIVYQLQAQPDYFFQITVPNEAQPIGKLFNCLVTAGIETDTCAPQWLEGVNRMDLTLVSSNHAKSVFENTKYEKRDDRTGQPAGMLELSKPVEVLFEGVDLNQYFVIDDDDMPDIKLVNTLDDIEEDYCFLFVGHWLPGAFGHDRKNVGQTIEMFLRAFKGKKKKPALILKTSHGATSIPARDEILNKISRIIQFVNSKDLPNVYLLHGEVSDEEMNILYNHYKIKCMVYFGHGEGFGRPLAEFTQAKKPIIATNWSGHLDFLPADQAILINGQLNNVHPSAVMQDMILADSKWFYIDPNQAVLAMKNIYENPTKHADRGKRLAYNIKTNFSYDAMKNLLAEKLERVPKAVPLKLPALKKIELPKLTNKKQLLKD